MSKTEHIRIAAQYLMQQPTQFAADLGREVEKERQTLRAESDAEWNAALEAAVKAVDAAFEADEDISAQEVIRALKREVKP